MKFGSLPGKGALPRELVLQLAVICDKSSARPKEKAEVMKELDDANTDKELTPDKRDEESTPDKQHGEHARMAHEVDTREAG